MMKPTKIVEYIIFFPLGVIIFLFGLFPHTADAGFGVSPAFIQEQYLVPGATLERTFYLIQGTPDAALDLTFSIESDTASEWITIQGVENGVMTIPQGIQQFPVVIQIKVPADAEDNIHRVFIRANTVPKSGTGQVSIALAAKISLELTVGDEIFEGFEVSNIQFVDIPLNGSPKANVHVKNIGNIPSGPDSATFELFNKFGDVRLAFAQIDGTISEVPAFTEETIRLEFPLDIKIGLGEYWGTVKIYDGQKLVKEAKSVFRVRDDLPPEDENTDKAVEKSDLASLLMSFASERITIAVGFVVVFLVFGIAFFWKRALKKK